ncbi:ATP-dependent translocase ABCB1-like [Schistocerca nitens]|uniref:ATP-dependent translocase ABCB1-like n=1 Tax=Schistocerca nitens TaxID=7011 RepID=UPI0021199DD2|nr:ATP-dependent translocase ABCB1-like [Schistocerca nitens]
MKFGTQKIPPDADMSELVEPLLPSYDTEDEVSGKISAEDTSREKKSTPIERASTEELEGEESPSPVPFLKLYRFSTAGERFVLALGLMAGLGAAAVKPIVNLLFGDFTKTMVDYGGALANATASGTTVSDNETAAFLDGAKNYAMYSCIVGAVNFLFIYVCISTFNCVAHRQVHRIRELYLRSVLQQDMAWYDMHQTGDFASRMSGDLSKLEDGIGEKVVMFIRSIVGYVGCVVMALVRGWELALVCLLSLPLCVVSLIATDVYSSRLADKEADEEGKAGAVAREVFAAIRTVVAFDGRDKEAERYSEKLQGAFNISKRKNFINGINEAVSWISMFGGYAVAFWYGVELIIRDKDYPESQKTYDVSTMITIFFSVMNGTWVFYSVTARVEAFSTARGAAAKIFAVIDRESHISSVSDEGDKPHYARGDITFKNVHFEYPSRRRVQILQGLNLKVKAGETVALVGCSGCGKSTCIQLIQRFYDPRLGSVELDGRDLRTLNVGWLRSQIGVVGQEPVLFQTTIAENIRNGRDDCTMEDIEEAAKTANAHGFISKLPQGYDTLVGERGAQLSGGQKQRIAIARALVRRPKILLLDEATSALDTGSEAKVQAALDKAIGGRTTIIVAHRLSTVRNADRIVVLSGGVVVEEGSHDQLMALNSHYHALVTTQLKTNETGERIGDDRPVLERLQSERSDTSSVVGDRVAADDVVEDAEDEEEAVAVGHAGVLPVLRLSAPEWRLLATGTLSALVVGVSFPTFSMFYGDVIGVLSQPDPVVLRSQTYWYCAVFIIMAVVMSISSFLQIYTFDVAGDRLTMRLRKLTFSAMLRQEMAWFDDKNNSTGALCTRLSTDTSAVRGATGQPINSVVQALATLVLSVGLCLYYEWRLGLLTIAFMPVQMASEYYDAHVEKAGDERMRKSLEKATKVAVEAVGNIRTVAGLCRERQFHAQYLSELRPALHLAEHITHVRAAAFSLSWNIGTFTYAACMYYGAILVHADGVPYQDVYKVAEVLIWGTGTIGSALSCGPRFRKGLRSASRIFNLLERRPLVTDPHYPTDDTWAAEGEVRYSDVEFSYPTRPDSMVLRGLDLIVKPGQTVALVGPSGCGKSTCVQLLERFYDATSGTVALDDRDVSKVKMSSLRSRLGLVQQEPVLFDRTIGENIAYGDNSRDVPMDDIIEMAKKANIHNFIKTLPKGYNTLAGDKGAQLSGGQKQRVAIARALLRNPSVLILDEATSALDSDSEKIVQEALNKAKEGRTCVTIAHRLSTVQDADAICVISNGKVAEMGSHADLLAKRGIYYKLQCMQPT